MYKVIWGGLLLMSVFLVACGPAATPAPTAPPGPLEVEVTLGAPEEFDVSIPRAELPLNTPIRFTITNAGAIPHEFMIMPHGMTDHDMALAEVHEEMLGPGETATLEFAFTQPGEYEFSCLLPGHYEAGMFVPIEVRQSL